MNIRLHASSAVLAALALSVCVWTGSAHAQASNARAIAPAQMERMIEDQGYQLTGPVVRRGKVYIANVVGQGDEAQQLVLDAHDGRLLRRSPGSPAMRRQVGNPDDWGPLSTFFGGIFGRHDDVAPLSPPPDSDFYDTPKPKAPIKRAKVDTKPAITPAPVQGADKATAPAPAAAADPSPASPPVATVAKAPVAPSPDAGAAPPAAAPAKTAKPNDVPVTPLE